MFKSIRWRFIIIFLALVLVSLLISGVYIIQFTEQNSYDMVETRLDALSELIIPDLETKSNLLDQHDQVANVIKSAGILGFREEVFVVVNNTIVTSTTDEDGENATDVLSDTMILSALNGKIDREIQSFRAGGSNISVMEKVYPIVKKTDNRVFGVLYLRYDLKDTKVTVERSRVVIVQAISIALLATMVLGFLIANNVTKPINQLTKSARAMARGDFSQRVIVESDDEIGKLSEMFNLLNYQLKTSLSDISREKSKLEAIVNNIADGLIAITSDQRILHINDKALKLLSDNSVNKSDNYGDIGHFLHEKLTLTVIKKRHPNWQGSETITLVNRTYRIRFEPFESEGMQRGGLIIIFQDITESYLLETMRKEFVANVSHELKTPITSIKSYAETLMDGALEDKEIAYNFLKVINGETDRMSRLVKDLLQLSNFDAKSITLDIDAHNYCDLIKTTVGKMGVHAKQKNQIIGIQLPEYAVIGTFDYHRVEQVIINLISNAIKYTPEFGKIDVSLIERQKSVLIRVSDTGIGIDQSDIPNLFERFYRVDKGRSRAQGGTGLGLAIVKEIVELHQGSIKVDSILGKGTSITVTMPYKTTVVA